METLEKLNQASQKQAETSFLDCCGSRNWARKMTESRPFANFSDLLEKAETIWRDLDEKDWLEAFTSHPKIGDRKAAPTQQAQSAEWSGGEQAGMKTATDFIKEELSEANRLYEKKFGYIFIVCATGKTAEEMLSICRGRLKNDLDKEIFIAAEEQRKITDIRLKKITRNRMSAITTHILDVSLGRPANNVPVVLERQSENGWEIIGRGETDDDGRLRDLMNPETILQKGNYRLTFDTETYFKDRNTEGFYPQVTVAFTICDASQHYHVPLLLSPFGFSTYRGS